MHITLPLQSTLYELLHTITYKLPWYYMYDYKYPTCQCHTDWHYMAIWNPIPLDRIGQNGTYWFVPVRTGTTRYKTVRECDGPSRTYRYHGMYQYIQVRTFNKTSCFLTHPERVRRDKIKVVQLLCMGYNVT
jgi:hypothetical protein